MRHNNDWPGVKIEPGDFIKAGDSLCMGIVLQCGSVKFGRGWLAGYVVALANGDTDFIDAASAVLIAPGEEHFARLVGPQQGVAA